MNKKRKNVCYVRELNLCEMALQCCR